MEDRYLENLSFYVAVNENHIEIKNDSDEKKIHPISIRKSSYLFM